MKKCRWNEYETNYLVERWNKDKAKDIAQFLDRTINSIRQKATALGLKNSGIWSKEEIILLEESWGVLSMNAIAKKINRTVGAIKKKAFKLGLRDHLHSREEITLNHLSIALGLGPIHAEAKKSWIKKGMPVKYKKTVKRKYAVINIEDFWKWVEKNKQLFDFSKLEKNTLGIEPKWIDEKRKIDLQRPKNNNQKWSKEEEELLISYLKKHKYTYSDLALMMNRSEKGVRSKIGRMKLKIRPIPRSTKDLWKSEDDKKIEEMIKNGHTHSTIARELGKSELYLSEKFRKGNIRKNIS